MMDYFKNNWLQLVQLAISVFLIITILMQQRGAGLGGVFGGQDTGSYSTRRGIEEILFYTAIILSILFFASALAQIVL